MDYYLNKSERDARFPRGNARIALDALEAAGPNGLTVVEVRDEHGGSVARSFRSLRGKERRKAGERPVMKMVSLPDRTGPVYILPEFLDPRPPQW